MGPRNGGGEQNSSRTLSQSIAAKLTRRIVADPNQAGARLPTERELAEEYGVARHVVREALKRLEAVGLVHIRQGSGIYVQDLQLTGGIELFDVLLRHDDGSINIEYLKDVLEFRAQIARTVVRLAAERRTDLQMDEIREAVRARRACGGDPSRLPETNLRMFRLFVEAAHNRVYTLIYNTMGRLSVQLGTLVDIPLMGFEQTQRLLERIVEAFEGRDSAMADLLLSRHLDLTFARATGRPDGNPPAAS